MITITNGKLVLTVPNSAYNLMYKASGFHPLEDEEPVEASAGTFLGSEEETPSTEISVGETDESEPLAEADADEAVDLSEIPLSEMDFYQLCDYADQLGLNRQGLRSKKELRALIKSNT